MVFFKFIYFFTNAPIYAYMLLYWQWLLIDVHLQIV